MKTLKQNVEIKNVGQALTLGESARLVYILQHQIDNLVSFFTYLNYIIICIDIHKIFPLVLQNIS